MEELIIRHRNSLRHHYTQTSNVLLFGYKHVSDGAKVTYQIVDSYDWSDSAGKRKGYAFPSLSTLAKDRGLTMRTLRRHLAELEQSRLVTRHVRRGKPSLLIIENPSAQEVQRYLETRGLVGEDKIVRPTPDKNVRPQEEKKEEEKERLNLVNEHDSFVREDGGEMRPPEHISRVIKLLKPAAQRTVRTPPNKPKREYLAREMLAVLKDEHSLGYYRKVADTVEEARIFEALSLIKQTSREENGPRNKGAMFVSIVRARGYT